MTCLSTEMPSLLLSQKSISHISSIGTSSTGRSRANNYSSNRCPEKCLHILATKPTYLAILSHHVHSSPQAPGIITALLIDILTWIRTSFLLHVPECGNFP